MDTLFESVSVYIIIAILFWLLVREIMCWYWKINRAITLLESIDRKLDKLPTGGEAALSEDA